MAYFATSETAQKTYSFIDSGCYFREAFSDPALLIEAAETQLKGQKVEFDSMVALGLSGMLVLPTLAHHFKVPFLALRKEGVKSHDNYGIGSYGRGEIGKRWLFVDDFVASGTTIRTAQDRINEALEGRGFKTTYVGTYCYSTNYGKGQFVDPFFNKKSLVKLNVDGKDYYVDGGAYSSFRSEYAYYRKANVIDPKGRAITNFRADSFYASETTLDELSMMAICIEKELNGLPTEKW